MVSKWESYKLSILSDKTFNPRYKIKVYFFKYGGHLY